MRADKKLNRLFYQDGKVSAVKTGDTTRRLLRHGGTLLTDKSSAADLALLATSLSGSVLRVVHGDHDEIRNYSCYGFELNQSQENAIGFNGEMLDLATQCYALGNGYRLFSPTAMRFHSPDNLSPFDRGGINAYCYCVGDPTNKIDPSGHLAQLPPRSSWLHTHSREARIMQATKELSHARRGVINKRHHIATALSTPGSLFPNKRKVLALARSELAKYEAQEHYAVKENMALGLEIPSYTRDEILINNHYFAVKDRQQPARTTRISKPTPSSSTHILNTQERETKYSHLTLKETQFYNDRQPLQIIWRPLEKIRNARDQQDLQSLI
ncbi:RHS repeat-associated core domain-containing protein [Pseudomonas sp. NBRC 111123]|uniref:RHS repeat-associated core domain-containing protein n=1 Tax=Pseudomonas sp. NBRC 111123 TaxID=1661038 RepID=UPI0009E89C6B|nr:RHS repeat-associated core domain-containing protein [Pseudomonas sp. NBRC 111123]